VGLAVACLCDVCMVLLGVPVTVLSCVLQMLARCCTGRHILL
jgi:hypothetical protein